MVAGRRSRICWKVKYETRRATGSRSTTTIFGAPHTRRTAATRSGPPEKYPGVASSRTGAGPAPAQYAS